MRGILPIWDHLTPPRVARFWSRVEVRGADECWPWTGRRDAKGYGVMSIEPRGTGQTLNLLAHRIAKTLELGRDLFSPELRHLCNNEPCCNARHLIEGTAVGNYQDAVAAGTTNLRPMLAMVGGVYGVSHPAARYTEDERLKAIQLWRDQPIQRITMAEIARRIGCHRSTVAYWLYDAFPEAFVMPANMRRARRGSRFAAERQRSEEHARMRTGNRAIIAARRAEREAQK